MNEPVIEWSVILYGYTNTKQQFETVRSIYWTVRCSVLKTDIFSGYDNVKTTTSW